MIDIGELTLIGLCGRAGSGKTHVAQSLAAELNGRGDKAAVVSFGTPIKQMLGDLLTGAGMPNREVARALYGEDKTKPLRQLQGRSARWAMQTLGTEWGRNLIGANLWIDISFTRCAGLINSGYIVIFDDVRFPSEVAAIRDRGGRVIQVYNPAITGTDDHVSERLPPYDSTYENVYYEST